ncbi:hypothetical protein CIL03_08715 [Virgibacillus indicus]|uniref:YHS domain-containing protein n=1 Tax=Virgibacillus indicus TaxID=2024554 RepID=A0A265NB79_9BACI|nr:YHS domain-containing protein [Virgibacillus indicus]OZU89087.1 hypothetical protein CIL03_08715 [Virgibacillus indicus]
MTTKCTVSGVEMEVNSSALQLTYKGNVYYLCCESCVEEFNSNPEKYVENYYKN